jgi:hypothetical protein
MGRIENQRTLWRDVLIVACAISAGIHAALTPEHFEEGVGAGGGFLVATILLGLVAVGLTRRTDEAAPARAAALILAGLLASYGLAVTVGVPMLHPYVEPLDRLALTTKAIELAGLLAALPLLAEPHPFRPLRTKGTPT